MPQSLCLQLLLLGWTRLHHCHPMGSGAGLPGWPGWPLPLLEQQGKGPVSVPLSWQPASQGTGAARGRQTQCRWEMGGPCGWRGWFPPRHPPALAAHQLLLFRAGSPSWCQLRIRAQGGCRSQLWPGDSRLCCRRIQQAAAACWERWRCQPAWWGLPGREGSSGCPQGCVFSVRGWPRGAALGVGGPSCQASCWDFLSWGRIMLLAGPQGWKGLEDHNFSCHGGVHGGSVPAGFTGVEISSPGPQSLSREGEVRWLC